MDRPGPWELAALAVVGISAAVLLYLAAPDSSPQSADTTLPSIPPPTVPSTVPATTTPPTTVSTVAPLPPPAATEVSTLASWESLDAPFERIWNPAVVWTGSELVVWGGDRSGQPFDGNNIPANTGYLYDPVADSWSVMAESEMCPMGRARGIWTEGAFTAPEVVVWPVGSVVTGVDCVRYGAYNPATDSWRYLEDEMSIDFFSRISEGTSVVWTGELLVAPDVSLALDPVDGPLLTLPDLPRNADDAVFSPRLAHWTGEEVLVMGSDELYAWDGGDEWEEYDGPPIPDRARTSAWDGERLLAVNYELAAAWWQDGAWTALDPLPLRFYECSPRGVASDEILAIDFCGPLAVWDGERQLFVPLPAPVDWGGGSDWRGGFPVAAADSIFVFGDGVFRYRITEDTRGAIDLPTTMPIGAHFLDRPVDVDLVRSVGPLGFDFDGQYYEMMRFEFESESSKCSVAATYGGVAQPPGERAFGAVISSRSGEVVWATEYHDGDRLTIRLPARNGSDVLDISCTTPNVTRLFASSFWEPEY